MSAEDKIAEIRRGVEERGREYINQTHFTAAMEAVRGVVIYGVPLNEQEVRSLARAVKNASDELSWCDGNGVFLSLLEMLERGKK